MHSAGRAGSGVSISNVASCINLQKLDSYLILLVIILSKHIHRDDHNAFRVKGRQKLMFLSLDFHLLY